MRRGAGEGDGEAEARAVARAILTWLAGEPDLLGRFLAISGARPDTLRGSVDDPSFLAGLIEFLMAHEPSLLAFCKATATPPERVVAAHHRLSGPAFDGS
ncbi:DUF3572 domain-containing protein [Aurantimonas sp. MSK8Z-1]|uniref:DUF3572 domain-containing protein n=1 Tax=Mangrovibrevibacter kandeliae TaxID=2968473 RepID=UPI002117FD90|nr:DUF3572 domain-containing protein [Aurantimonas sp. MSK8Z-1]MCW4115020.1 DUF3572 domain-containing protein [Aurantimonas sp. MSK8Z-1]